MIKTNKALYILDLIVISVSILYMSCALLSRENDDEEENITFNEVADSCEISHIDLLRICYREKLSDIEYMNKRFGTPIGKHLDTVRYGETSTYSSFDYLIYLATKDNPECVIESYYWTIVISRDLVKYIEIYYLKSENELIPLYALMHLQSVWGIDRPKPWWMV